MIYEAQRACEIHSNDGRFMCFCGGACGRFTAAHLSAHAADRAGNRLLCVEQRYHSRAVYSARSPDGNACSALLSQWACTAENLTGKAYRAGRHFSPLFHFPCVGRHFPNGKFFKHSLRTQHDCSAADYQRFCLPDQNRRLRPDFRSAVRSAWLRLLPLFWLSLYHEQAGLFPVQDLSRCAPVLGHGSYDFPFFTYDQLQKCLRAPARIVYARCDAPVFPKFCTRLFPRG